MTMSWAETIDILRENVKGLKADRDRNWKALTDLWQTTSPGSQQEREETLREYYALLFRSLKSAQNFLDMEAEEFRKASVDFEVGKLSKAAFTESCDTTNAVNITMRAAIVTILDVLEQSLERDQVEATADTN